MNLIPRLSGWRGRPPSLGATQNDPYSALQRQMDDLLEDFSSRFGAPFLVPASETAGLDVAETEQELEIKADLPGVAEEDVTVSLRDDVLTIRSERQDERTEEKPHDHLHGRYGAFTCAVPLPFETDAGAIEATFEKGVLTVKVPKTKEVDARTKRIEIRSAA